MQCYETNEGDPIHWWSSRPCGKDRMMIYIMVLPSTRGPPIGIEFMWRRRLIIRCHHQRVRTRRAYSDATAPKMTHVGFGEFCLDVFYAGVVETQSALETLHFAGGLPWWACISTGAAAARLLVLPLRIFALQQSLLLAQANQAVAQRVPLLRATTTDPRRLRAELGKSWMAALRERGTHPFRTLLPVVLHVPLFLALGAAVRRMSDVPFLGIGAEQLGGGPVEGWSAGGLLFFADLAATNLILTVTAVLSNLLAIEWIFRGSRLEKAGRPPHKRLLYWLMHGLGIVSAPILWILPAGINWFVLVNNALAVVEGQFLLRTRWLYRLLHRRVSAASALRNPIYQIRPLSK